MSVSNCETFYEDVPTLGEVKREISSIVGLREIKKQLESILQKIIDAEKNAADGFRVVPPKPFHMVFVGRNGTGGKSTMLYIFMFVSSCSLLSATFITGKSTVARIIGKLFYLAGVLSSYTVTEMRGHQKMRDASGGLLLVKIDEEDPISSDTMEELIAAIDKGKSLIVLAGNHRALNQYMKCNLNLYRRLSTRLQFDDLTCEDLAMILEKKASIKGESDMLCGFELDSSCSTDSIARMIAELTPHNLRSLLNAHLLDQMLIEAKKVARPGENTISLKNLEMGIQNGAEIFKHLLNL